MLIKMLILLNILFFGCQHSSGVTGWSDLAEKQQLYSNDDYINHLDTIAKDYVTFSKDKVFRLYGQKEAYLLEIYNHILKNNELLLKTRLQPKFYVVKDKIPFCFSLPRGHFFFSWGLIANYFKHEGLLLSAFAFEIVKNHLHLYEKKLIVPIGYLETEKILSLTRISLDIKMEINRWTFYAMRRSGLDGFVYLLWVQLQNKNALDFTLQLGDLRNISREEFLFKNFIVKEIYNDKNIDEFEINSSSQFYSFVKEIRKIRI